jgi:hypothetical protein
MSSAGSDASGSLPRLNWTSVVEPATAEAPPTSAPAVERPADEPSAPKPEPRWNPQAPVNLTAQLSALSIDMSFGGTALDDRPSAAPSGAPSAVPDLGGVPAAAVVPPATAAPAWPSSPLLGDPSVAATPIAATDAAPTLAPAGAEPLPRVSLPDVLRSALSGVPLDDTTAEEHRPVVASGNSAVDTGARPLADRFRPAEPHPEVGVVPAPPAQLRPTPPPTSSEADRHAPAFADPGGGRFDAPLVADPAPAPPGPLYGRLAFPDDPGAVSALFDEDVEDVEEPVEVPRIREATPHDAPRSEPDVAGDADPARNQVAPPVVATHPDVASPAAAPVVAHDLGTFEVASPAPAQPAPALVDAAPAVPVASVVPAAPPAATTAAAEAPPVTLPPSARPSRGDAAAIRFDKPIAMPSAKPKRRIGRTIAKTFLVLAVLAGLAGAGYVYGMPYLFPSDWPADVEPLANAVATAAGVEFVEPVQVETVASPEYDAFAVEALLSSSPHFELYGPTWRALGLATGDVSDADLGQLVAMWSPSAYNTRNGQIVIESQLAASPAGDAAVEVALAEALLDQAHQWSTDLARRGMDERVTMRAVASGQALAYAAAAGADVSTLVRDDNLLAFLPAPMAFELLAPYRVGPVLVGSNTTAFDAMYADMARGATWPKVLTSTPAIAPGGDLAAGDQLVVPPTAQGYSFWYMAFASYLDPITASGVVNAVEQDLLTSVDRAGVRCVIATFTPRAGSEQVLADGLAAWVAAAPSEIGATASIAANGAQQLQSCDPGVAFAGASRPMVAREALAIRLTEAAAVRYIVDQAGDEQSAMAAAVQLIRARNIGVTVARDHGSEPIESLIQAAVAAATPVAQEALAGVT